MQRFFFVLLLLLLLPATWPGQMIQAAEGIRLIVRGDDIGSSHAANIACIQSYKEGIVRSVELMVPGPWFPEAVKMLNENPGLDVGIHLVLTSEWANMKWRPLSCVPSLVDADGYFFPSVWQNPNFPPNTSIQKAKWKLDEVEKELRAQIETALRHVPRISHLDCHMGCSGLDPSMAMVEKKLAQEYHLEMHWWHGIQFVLWDRPELFESSLKFYANILEKAKQVARAQGYQGARWPKCVAFEGQQMPCHVFPEAFLIWQQPHPIYYAELLFQSSQDEEILKKYKDLVFATADFMASYVQWDPVKKRYIVGPPVAPGQEDCWRRWL